MASFHKVTTNSTSTPTLPLPLPLPLSPKPIATAAPPPPPPPFTRERFFSDGDDDEVEEEEEEEEENEEDEEDEEIVNGEHGGDTIDLEKIRGENWSSRDTYASSSGYENALVIAGSEPCYAHTFNRVSRSSPSSSQNDTLRGENNGCGFSCQDQDQDRDQEDRSYWDVLRSHLSDPVT